MGRDTPFVGRSAEVAVLGRALEQARAGRGRVVLVHGETGIGKTRLLAELAHGAAAARSDVLTGHAVRGSGAYRAVAEALVGHLRAGATVNADALGGYTGVLGRLLPDWPGGHDARGRPDPQPGPEPMADAGVVLGEAVARFLAELGREHGCLLVLEDLHWADPDTLAVVQHLAQAVGRSPVLVAASARDDEPGVDTVARLTGLPGLLAVRLGPLTRDAVAEWVAAVGRPDDGEALRRLAARAEGVPLLVEELLSGQLPEHPPQALEPAPGVAGALPATLLTLVNDRLGRLATAHRRVLSAAAVLGADPDWALLPDVSGEPDEEVVEALRAAVGVRLLVNDAGALRWRHAMTRDAVLAAMVPPERTVLARRAADVLLDRRRRDDGWDHAGDETTAAELLLEAGAEAQAVDVMLRLVRRDLAHGAARTAEALLDRVGATGLRTVAVATERVRLLASTGRAAQALATGGPALDRATGDEHAELALRLGRAAVLAGRWDDAVEYVARAGRPDDPRSASVLADACHGAGRVHAAEGHAMEAVAKAERAALPDALCEALVVQAKLVRLRDPGAAEPVFRRAAQVAAEHGLRAWRVEALTGVGTIELMKEETSATLPVARELAVEAGLLGQVASLDMIRTNALLLAAGPAAAGAAARELTGLGRLLRLPAVEATGRYLLALEPAAAGRTREMEQQLSEWAYPQEAGPEARFLPGAVRAVAAVVGHDLTAASRLLDHAIGPLLDHRSAAPVHEFGLWALLRTVVADRDDQARRMVRDHPAALRPANRGALRYADAVVAGRTGRPAEAADLVDAAEDTLSTVPWLRRLLRLPTLESAVTDGWGEPVPLLRESLAEHERAGEQLLARTCRDLLRRAGAPTRRGRGATPVPTRLAALGVTSREMDVLSLVAEGATNAQVAERLFLSPRTVETHVASLLQKTGAAGREELRRHHPAAG